MARQAISAPLKVPGCAGHVARARMSLLSMAVPAILPSSARVALEPPSRGRSSLPLSYPVPAVVVRIHRGAASGFCPPQGLWACVACCTSEDEPPIDGCTSHPAILSSCCLGAAVAGTIFTASLLPRTGCRGEDPSWRGKRFLPPSRSLGVCGTLHKRGEISQLPQLSKLSSPNPCYCCAVP